mgnify:CR=1 FL=1
MTFMEHVGILCLSSHYFPMYMHFMYIWRKANKNDVETVFIIQSGKQNEMLYEHNRNTILKYSARLKFYPYEHQDNA